MRGSAIYTQISWATICILSQGLREWICNIFLFLCVFHIFEEERVLNDNAIIRPASNWSWLHACIQGHVAIQFIWLIFMGKRSVWATLLASVGQPGVKSGVSTNLRWSWLDLNLHWIDMWWLSSSHQTFASCQADFKHSMRGTVGIGDFRCYWQVAEGSIRE